MLGRDADFDFRSTRIVSFASTTTLGDERTEAADFDAVFPNECLGHRFENGLDDDFHVSLGEAWYLSGHFLDELALCHHEPHELPEHDLPVGKSPPPSRW